MMNHKVTERDVEVAHSIMKVVMNSDQDGDQDQGARKAKPERRAADNLPVKRFSRDGDALGDEADDG